MCSSDLFPSHDTLLFNRLKALLETVTIANGYNNTVELVDDQHNVQRLETLPLFFINLSSEPLDHRPQQETRSEIVYTVTGGVKVDGSDESTDAYKLKLRSKIVSFRADFLKAFYSDQYLSGLMVEHQVFHLL